MKSIISTIFAFFGFALVLFAQSSADEIRKWKWKKDALKGDAYAQYHLGIMYDNGESVPEDDTEAVKWYRKAADQGFADAQYNLGVMYENGEGVTKSITIASIWYSKAADQGFADAQYNLGVLYENGEGVAEDSVEAMKWYRKAADQGNADARRRLWESVKERSPVKAKNTYHPESEESWLRLDHHENSQILGE